MLSHEFDRVQAACQALGDGTFGCRCSSIPTRGSSTRRRSRARRWSNCIPVPTRMRTESGNSQSISVLSTRLPTVSQLGLTVHAGHGLHYENVAPIAAIPAIVELNIGHAIVARAVFEGIESAVSRMKRLMRDARL